MSSAKCNKAAVTEADRAVRDTRRKSVSVCSRAAAMLLVCMCTGEGARRQIARPCCLFNVTNANCYIICSQATSNTKN